MSYNSRNKKQIQYRSFDFANDYFLLVRSVALLSVSVLWPTGVLRPPAALNGLLSVKKETKEKEEIIIIAVIASSKDHKI